MRKTSARLLMAALALLISFASPQPARALGSSAEPVQIGAFLTGLGDLDPIHKSFSAAFWLWSLSPETDGSPLDRMEFPNAIQLESPNAISESTPAGNGASERSSARSGMAGMCGTFRSTASCCASSSRNPSG